MKALESLAAVVLIVVARPVLINGSVGVMAAGRRPLFRTVSWSESAGYGQLMEFNTDPGRFGRLLADCGSSHLPSLFKVVAGTARLRDVASDIEQRRG
jgi:hypothetical protein